MKDSRPCFRCGRVITYRKKWEKVWDEVKYCSDRCRKGDSPLDSDEEKLLQLLKNRGAGKTICPSEILDGAGKQDKDRMEEVRQAARRLVQKGRILILQRGVPVDPSTFRGPIRLKLK